MLYADDAGTASRSPQRLARRVAQTTMVCQECKRTVAEHETKYTLLGLSPRPSETALSMRRVDQRYEQTAEFARLDGAVSADENIFIEIKLRVSAAWERSRKNTLQLSTGGLTPSVL